MQNKGESANAEVAAGSIGAGLPQAT